MKLLGICGAKEGGKSSTANYIVGLELVALQLIDHFSMAENGKLLVPAILEDGTIEEGEFDPAIVTPTSVPWLSENVWPHIQVYAFADKPKRVLIDWFDIKEEQLYGTNEQKNSLTHIKWENMPISSAKKKGKSGFMTGRELIQFFATEVVRSIDNLVWIKLLMKSISEDNLYFDNPNRICIINDVRFDTEATAIREAGGKILHLTRKLHQDDTHSSEAGVSVDLIDWTVDNQNMTTDEKNAEVLRVLTEAGFLDYNVENKGEMS